MGQSHDRAKGKVAEIGGAVQKKVGETIGSDEMEKKGAARQAEGEALQAKAKAKERRKGTAEVVAGTAKELVGSAIGDDDMEDEGDREVRKGKARTKRNE